MTIATAIAALAPNLWYKLDGSDGQSAPNSGSLANNGTVSGDVDWTVTGPEVGTTALRLYSTGRLVSAAMDISALAPMSMGLWIAMLAEGPVSTAQPIIGIGDVNNRFARGPLIYEGHSTIYSPTYNGRWNAGLVASGAPSDPKNGWHWIVVTIQSGTNGVKMFVDGVLTTQASPGSTTAALLSDPLMVASAQSAAVTHVCFWNSVISQADIQSVSNQRAPWPLGDPINRGDVAGGGGGGLTEAQAEQLGRIEGYVDDIPGLVDAIDWLTDAVAALSAVAEATQDTVDQINGKVNEALDHLNTLMAVDAEQILPGLNNIGEYVRRAFMNSVGALLHTPVGNVIAHPDPNLLSAAADTFTISGQGMLPSPGALGYANVYGIRWIASTIPPRAGYRDGVIDKTVQRLLQLVFYYPDQGTVIVYPQQVAEFHEMQLTYYWTRYWPHVIEYDVLPGFVLTCQYMIFQPIIEP